jgi:imidazolonepropionase-like amidohydrolase
MESYTLGGRGEKSLIPSRPTLGDPDATEWLITNVQVITMAGQAVIPKGFVALSGGVIEAVGAMADVPAARGNVLDLPGRTATPGLVNSHMHFHMHREFGPVAAPGPIALDAIRSARTALNCLRQGVTAARELGHNDHVRLTLRDSIREGLILGPRIVSAGAAIGFAHGHAHFVAENVGNLDELVDRIRAEVLAGADFIKIIASNEDLPNPPGDELAVPWFSRRAIEVAVETAHEAGVRIAAHANGRRTLEWAIDAGVDSVEHGIYIDPDLAAGMVEKGIYLVPTLSGYFENSRTYWERAWQPRYAELWAAHRMSIRHAVEAGVVIATGGDTIGTLPAEVEILRRFGGMSGMESLEAATSNGAKVLGLSGEAGVLVPGAPADLAIFQGDPIEDSAALFDVEVTFLHGVPFMRDELDRFVPASHRFIDRWHDSDHRCLPE